jgi:bacterioferritin-associated ferredoxin
MIICSCNVFSDNEVRTAVAVGAPPRTTGELFRYLGCSARCGRCAWSIKAIMDEHAGAVLRATMTAPVSHRSGRAGHHHHRKTDATDWSRIRCALRP